jgi:GT2 family glycosyltransferase
MEYSSLELLSGDSVVQEWVTGAALMVKREIFFNNGGFDEHFFMYFEDVDFCRSVTKSGFECRYIPSLSMIHLGGKSYTKSNDRILIQYRRSQLRYYDKHNSFFQRLAVRSYLALKFIPLLFDPHRRHSAAVILSLLTKYHGTAGGR